MWFAAIANRTWCFFPSLLSVVSDNTMHGVEMFAMTLQHHQLHKVYLCTCTPIVL